jgi:lysozyme family protein
MTTSTFPRALAVILREEGGNDDDPRDHGGRTSRGITQREWDAFRILHPGRPSDVWKATDADIAAIYSAIPYWSPYAILMPAGVDLCFFNASVNSGPRQAAKELQRCLRVDADGSIGNITLAALKSVNDRRGLIEQMSERRRIFYRSLAQCPIYCRGWLGRTDRVEKDALMLDSKKLLLRHIKPLAPEQLGRAKAYPPKGADHD